MFFFCIGERNQAPTGGGFDGTGRAGTRSDGRKQSRNTALPGAVRTGLQFSPVRSTGGRAADRGRSALSHCRRPCRRSGTRSRARRAAAAAPRCGTATTTGCRPRTAPDSASAARPTAVIHTHTHGQRG